MDTIESCRSGNISGEGAGGGGGGGAVVEKDTYVKIPASTLFQDIIRACLRSLGYSEASVLGAEGFYFLHSFVI